MSFRQRKASLRRQTPLKPSPLHPGESRLERRTEMRKSNPKRKRARFERAYGSKERVRWMKLLPCVVCAKCPTEVAHVRSRGAGGTAADTVPLCRQHHRDQHAMGIETFEGLHGIDLNDAARMYDQRWRTR